MQCSGNAIFGFQQRQRERKTVLLTIKVVPCTVYSFYLFIIKNGNAQQSKHGEDHLKYTNIIIETKSSRMAQVVVCGKMNIKKCIFIWDAD